jgi:hypothetical protein
MNRMKSMVAVAILLCVSIIGCHNTENTMDVSATSMKQFSIGPVVETIYAGQHHVVGTVTATKPLDEDTMTIVYKTWGDWVITETHTDWGYALSDIPQRNGNPVPGQFEYKGTYNPPVTSVTYKVHITGADCHKYIYDANHCVVESIVKGKVKQTNTGWSGNEKFPGKNWALYYRKTMNYKKSIRLPKDTISSFYNGAYPPDGIEMPIDTGIGAWKLIDVPCGYNVKNDSWYWAFCVQEEKEMHEHVYHDVMLYSTADAASLPHDFKFRWRTPKGGTYPESLLVEWDKINYIINHRMYLGEQWDNMYVQFAIWNYTSEDGQMSEQIIPMIPQSIAYIDSAEKYGSGYVPGHGDWVAVAMYHLDNNDDYQRCVIQVDP